MTTSKGERSARIALAFYRHGMPISDGHAEDLARDVQRLRTLAEADCNRGLTAREQATEQNAIKRIGRTLAQAFSGTGILLGAWDEASEGIAVEFGGDPRGCIVTVYPAGVPREYPHGFGIDL